MFYKALHEEFYSFFQHKREVWRFAEIGSFYATKLAQRIYLLSCKKESSYNKDFSPKSFFPKNAWTFHPNSSSTFYKRNLSKLNTKVKLTLIFCKLWLPCQSFGLKYFCTIDNLQKFLRILHNGKTWVGFGTLHFDTSKRKNYSPDQRNWHHFVSFHHQAYHPHHDHRFLPYPELPNDAYLKMCVFYLIKLQLKRGIGRALKMKVGM